MTFIIYVVHTCNYAFKKHYKHFSKQSTHQFYSDMFVVVQILT